MEEVFKKFQEWGEVNAQEHKLGLVSFLVRMLFFSVIGCALGAVGEIITRWLQGDRVENKWKCSGFALFQVSLVAILLYVLVSFRRYFDDWLLSTFTGVFFSLMLFNSQERLSDNLKCILP